MKLTDQYTLAMRGWMRPLHDTVRRSGPQRWIATCGLCGNRSVDITRTGAGAGLVAHRKAMHR